MRLLPHIYVSVSLFGLKKKKLYLTPDCTCSPNIGITIAARKLHFPDTKIIGFWEKPYSAYVSKFP
jgi:hypothetical protein